MKLSNVFTVDKKQKMSDFMRDNGVFVFLFIAMLTMYVVSYYNYLLFHSIAEIFSIAISVGIFIVVWNARRFEIKSYVVLIGISFLFAAIFNIFHLLAYKGLGVFPGNTANLATQLWIALRFVEAVSLLLVPFIFNKKINHWLIFVCYSFITIILFLSIFYWKNFPVCFVDGVGLTTFKKVSEFIILIIFVGATAVVFLNRKKISASLRWIVFAALFFNVVGEIFFIFYTNVFALSNMFGHLADIFASFLIYKAVMVVGLSRPYDFLFKDLKNTNDFNQALLAAIPYGIDIVDEKGNIVFVNEKFTQIFGQDALNKKCWQIFKGRDKQCPDCPLYKIGNQEKNISLIKDSYFLNGRTYDISYKEMIYGGKMAILEIFQDVTQRKNTEEKMAHLASFPELNPNPILEMNENGEIIYTNPALKKNHSDIEIKKHDHPFLIGWQDFIAKFKNEKNDVLSREIQVGDFWYDQVVSHVPSSNSFRFYCRNITVKKIMEEKLIKAKNEWEMTFDSVPDLIAIIDNEHRIVRANKAMADKLKTDAGKCIGLNCYNCVHNLSAPIENCPHSRTLKDGKEHFAEIHEDNLGGDFLISTTPIIDKNGSVTGSVHVARDITRQKKADKAKTEFLSMASHQLRTPLSSISLIAELLLRGVGGNIEPAQKKYLKDIFVSAQRMSELITDLLNATRIEMNTFNVNPEKIDIVFEAEKIANDLKFQLEEKQIKLKISTSDNKSHSIMFDKNIFRLMFENLLTNAIRYNSEKGSVEVNIGYQETKVLVSVSDTGCGIPPEEQEKIFGKLFRASNARIISADGEGLGLYIVKSVAQRIGVDVWFEPNSNSSGTTFFISIPVK
ncbi:MAG: MASE3 domain-containing protein [Candidatus Magasanikiibacteriota bacterium]